MLQNALAFRLLQDRALRVYNSADDVLVLRDYEAEDAIKTEEEVVNRVALLVNVGVACSVARSHLGGNPRQHLLLACALEQVKLLQVFSVDLHGDVEAQVNWQLVDEQVQTRHVQAVVKLERLLDLEEQVVCDLVLLSQVV